MKQKIILPIWISLAVIGFVIPSLTCVVCMWFIGIPLFIIINVGMVTVFYLMKKNLKSNS